MNGTDLVLARITAGSRRAKPIAEILGWTPSKISRVEHAVDPSADDVRDYLAAVETYKQRVAHPATLATNATSGEAA